MFGGACWRRTGFVWFAWVAKDTERSLDIVWRCWGLGDYDLNDQVCKAVFEIELDREIAGVWVVLGCLGVY